MSKIIPETNKVVKTSEAQLNGINPFSEFPSVCQKISEFINTIEDFFTLCQRISTFFKSFNVYQTKVSKTIKSRTFRFITFLSFVDSCIVDWRDHLEGKRKLTPCRINEITSIFEEWMKDVHESSLENVMNAETCKIIETDIQQRLGDFMSIHESESAFKQFIEKLNKEKESLMNQSEILNVDISITCEKHQMEFEQLKQILPKEICVAIDKIGRQPENHVFQFWFMSFYLTHEYKPNMPLRTDFETFSENLVSTGYNHFKFNSPLLHMVFCRFEPEEVLSSLNSLISKYVQTNH